MILPIDTYYQASETEARLARHRPNRKHAYRTRNAIGRVLIGLGRRISVESAGAAQGRPR